MQYEMVIKLWLDISRTTLAVYFCQLLQFKTALNTMFPTAQISESRGTEVLKSSLFIIELGQD